MHLQNYTLISKIKNNLNIYKNTVKKPARGALKKDYLVPSGRYSEQWDWDAFFIGVALANEIPSEAIYLKNWALNYIFNSENDGKVAGCIIPAGNDPRLNQMKPFLAQGIYLSSNFLNDWEWIGKYWEKIKNIVLYRERNMWNDTYGLGYWHDMMESGADNNPAGYNDIKDVVLAVDLNTFLYREYIALMLIAEKLFKEKDVLFFRKRAETLRKNILKHLWNTENSILYNLDSRTGKQIKVVSYSCFIGLWADILDKTQADATIQKYLLNKEEMLAKYGIRTLSKKHPQYNNENIIKPHSNWQGPIWIISNYLYIRGLMNYGYQKEAIKIAKNITNLLCEDIEKTGEMHENYNADTGEALAAPGFVSWNLLANNMLEDVLSKKDPFQLIRSSFV